MHSVQRSPEPDFLAALRVRYAAWEELQVEERRRVRFELAQDFQGICGYCEQLCEPTTPGQLDNEESVDHFRPRSRFPAEWLDWLNLVYSCRRCNQAKDNKWPVLDDADNLRLDRISRYRQVSEYVCPNRSDLQAAAETFFAFDVDNGEIRPVNDLAEAEWSVAFRTIFDLDLNSSTSGDDLPNQRVVERQLLDQTLLQVFDSNLRQVIVAGLVQPHRPFSGFMSAYAKAIGFDV